MNELRRISQTADRKVRFNTPKVEDTSAAQDDSTKGAAELPPVEEDTVPTKDKESDPTTALEAIQENKQDLPIRSKESESQ